MRQHHVAGDKLFIDYCGPTVDIVNPDTGACRECEATSTSTSVITAPKPARGTLANWCIKSATLLNPLIGAMNTRQNRL